MMVENNECFDDIAIYTIHISAKHQMHLKFKKPSKWSNKISVSVIYLKKWMMLNGIGWDHDG